MSSSSSLQARVHQMRHEAPDILSVELRPLALGTDFVHAAEAGDHIDLQLADGLTRSYSLTNPGDSHRYVVAVALEPQSRGGSRFVHESLRVGQALSISAPRNHFRLHDDAPHSVLLAGGIGITPLYAMLRRLAALQRRAHLIYCASRREGAAFVSQIESLVAASNGRLSVDWQFKDERGARADLARVLSGHPEGTHFYACGSSALLEGYEQACAMLGLAHVHLERFAAVPKAAAQMPVEGYTVELRKSCRRLHVAAGMPLLDALIDAGMDPEHSCREGVCGACEVRVISGDVDHRDQILSPQEQATNRSMMICVSGCRSGTLVLDL